MRAPLGEAEIFGKRVRELRLKAGWTQEQLAEAAGITTTYTSDLERGTKLPSLTVILRVSRAFRVSVGSCCGSLRWTRCGG